MTKVDISTRERILAAATPLFAAHGFGGVSLRAIAAAANVPLGGIPYHFGSKDGLYRAIWEKWMDMVSADMLLERLGAFDAPTPKEGLRRIVEAFFAGPRAILHEEDGQHFIAIMVREANDPNSINRDLLDSFIYPNGEIIRAALVASFPDLSADRFNVGFQMTISALRIAIEDNRAPRSATMSPDQINAMFAIASQFVVSGWLAIIE